MCPRAKRARGHTLASRFTPLPCTCRIVFTDERESLHECEYARRRHQRQPRLCMWQADLAEQASEREKLRRLVREVDALVAEADRARTVAILLTESLARSRAAAAAEAERRRKRLRRQGERPSTAPPTTRVRATSQVARCTSSLVDGVQGVRARARARRAATVGHSRASKSVSGAERVERAASATWWSRVDRRALDARLQQATRRERHRRAHAKPCSAVAWDGSSSHPSRSRGDVRGAGVASVCIVGTQARRT